jgi:hypothetical protein
MSSAPEPKPEQQEPKGKGNFWVQAARYSELAGLLPAASAVGWLAGTGLDRWLHASWISAVGFVMGTAIGLFELIRTLLRDTR